MESEKGWAVWSPQNNRILLWTVSFDAFGASLRFLNEAEFSDWAHAKANGYRVVQITINYEKPQASDED